MDKVFATLVRKDSAAATNNNINFNFIGSPTGLPILQQLLMFSRFFLISFIFYSCSASHNKIELTNISTFDLNQNVSKEIKIDKLLLISEVISLELSDESPIELVDNFIKYGPDFYLLNYRDQSGFKDLMKFDELGNFNWKIKSETPGPSTFYGYRDFLISNDTIEILDGLQRKIKTFDLSGKYLSSLDIDFPGRYFSKINHEEYLINLDNEHIFSDYASSSSSNIHYRNLGKSTSKATAAGKIPLLNDLSIQGRRFFKSKNTNYPVYAIDSVNDTIFEFDNNTLTPKLVIRVNGSTKTKRLQQLKTQFDKLSNSDEFNFEVLNFLNDHELSSKFLSIHRQNNDIYISLKVGEVPFIIKHNLDTNEFQSVFLNQYGFNNAFIFGNLDPLIHFVIHNPNKFLNNLDENSKNTHINKFQTITHNPNPMIISTPISSLF